MHFYILAVRQPRKLLVQLDKWIEHAIAHAEKVPFDPNVLLTARLAPDMFPFVRQVQTACDNAKFGAARLSRREAPKHPDTEATLDDLRARIASVIEWLDALPSSDFAEADTRVIALPFMPGKTLTGAEYLVEMANPNLYFHLSMAYAILRHNGVPLGKRDFLGPIDFRSIEGAG
jgi:hypothetical protein